MVAIDVRSLLKRAKAEKEKLDDSPIASKASDGLLAAETLKQHASQQVPLPLAQYTVTSSVQVNSSPLQGIFYVPAFLTREEEVQLLQAVDAAPAARWMHAGERQMQNWGGRPGEAVIREKLPQFLQALVELLLAAGVYPLEQAPQHVLINSYSKAAGISPHMDGPLYSPCVATITLGGPALMAFHEVQPDGTQGQLATEGRNTSKHMLHSNEAPGRQRHAGGGMQGVYGVT
ncbi:TPA: hypothetical protein ACH3X1_004622 [Trebouxia sp. C0004]